MDQFYHDKFYHSVGLQEELCKGCIDCLKRCPTQAIRVRNGKARIESKFCIDCGECIRVCQYHAKQSTYDKADLQKQYAYTIALPDSSLYGQFNNLDDVNLILNTLLAMGFDDVYEVGAAAEIVSEATRAYIKEHADGLPYISTACPSVVRLIRMRFPNLLPNLLPINPPMEVAASLAAQAAMEKTGLPREKIGIFFLSPCPSKVTYARSPLGTKKSQVDHVLAIKELYPQLVSQMEAFQGSIREINACGKIGIGFGRRGGEAAGLLLENYLTADGIENVIRVLEDLEDQKFSNLKFVELSACSGGCVGGVLTVENPYAAEAKLKHLSKYMPVSRSHMEPGIEHLVLQSEEITYEPVLHLGESILESFARLNQVERLCKKLPGLDCGSCGAPTCKALAEDIVRGKAAEQDCAYYVRENLHRLLDETSALSDDVHAGMWGERENLTSLKEQLRKLSEEVALLETFTEKERQEKK
ncbi:MAG: [Fe-Fe] hydrogenase large subunit C-terminal domain-containing protein [Clostridiales bacterium]|nr:[Fe-Fe] hydrogenase large subunit C-terminal domain-containing protein [Clostridiales bacterium]